MFPKWVEVCLYNKFDDQIPAAIFIIEAENDLEADDKASKLCNEWNVDGYYSWDFVPELMEY